MNPKLNPGGWFEIPVTDMDRAKTFYEAAFGITLEEKEMGPVLMAWFPMNEDMNTYGAAGTLIKGDGYVPSKEGSLIYLNVTDIEETLGKITDAGGTTMQEKMDIGDYGYIAVFEDSEGNRVAIHMGNK